MAKPLGPWLFADDVGALCSLLGVKLQKNMSRMFREERMRVLNFQRSQVAIAWMSIMDWGEQFIVDFG